MKRMPKQKYFIGDKVKFHFNFKEDDALIFIGRLAFKKKITGMEFQVIGVTKYDDETKDWDYQFNIPESLSDGIIERYGNENIFTDRFWQREFK